MSTPRILVIGHSGSGKTLVGDILAEMYDTVCTNTSDVLMDEYGDARGFAACEILSDKDAHRVALFDFANENPDPAHLARTALESGSIVAGLRRRVEFAACRAAFDLCVWKDSPHVTAGETDELTVDHADIVVPWSQTEDDLREYITAVVMPYVTRPEVYIVGRYRHWLPNGEWDFDRMDLMATEEGLVAGLLRGIGLRPFEPITTHAPLDDFWGEGSPKRILSLCREKLLRMRHRDAICVRHGWRDVPGLPDSAGSGMEIETAVAQGLGVLYTQHGDDALKFAAEMLMGRS